MTDNTPPSEPNSQDEEPEVRVRRIHRRDLNRVWEFLKLVFRGVNRETVEYQRPRLKQHFFDIYEKEGIEQLLFELKKGEKHELVGYVEFAYEIVGSDNFMNHRYFAKRDMRPLFVEEIAVHPGYHGLGIGSFIFEQIEHQFCVELSEVSQGNAIVPGPKSFDRSSLALGFE